MALSTGADRTVTFLPNVGRERCLTHALITLRRFRKAKKTVVHGRAAHLLANAEAAGIEQECMWQSIDFFR